MRVSDISAWSQCETMALTDPRHEFRVSVASWVGTLAHAKLLRQPSLPWPQRLRFDAITQTAHQAAVQADAIAAYGERLLAHHGWEVMEAEKEVYGESITGHLDIKAWHSERQEAAIIDLKTGYNIGAGWLQVGGYLTLDGTSVDNGGILHIPRVKVGKETQGTLEIRPGHALANAWTINMVRFNAVMAGAAPTLSPGLHCGRCAKTNCPVRP